MSVCPRIGLRWTALLLLTFQSACSWNYSPRHEQVDAASLQKLKTQVRDPAPLGYEVKDGSIRFPLNVQSPDTVTLPMTLRGGMPSIWARLNDGPPVHMILDTGAQRTVLDARTAISHNVVLLDPGLGGPTLAGSLGKETGYLGLLKPFQLGEFSMSRYVCLVRTHQNAIRYFGELKRSQISLDIIGMDLPKKVFSYLTLDYKRAQAKLSISSTFEPQEKERVWKSPIIWKDDLPHVYVHSGNVRWLALVDSGFSDAYEVTEDIARRTGIFDRRVSVSGGYQIAIGGSQTAGQSVLGVAMMPRVEGAGPPTINIPAIITQGRPKIGSALMRNFTVTIDFKRSVLWFEDRPVR